MSLPKLNKLTLAFWFCVWLLFLPNAPYIITDLLHLKISTNDLLWLDILVINAFALTGLLVFFLSLFDMKTLLNKIMSANRICYFTTFIIFLCGFGVYLGRFLRYNSWEIVSNPTHLSKDVINIIFNPFTHKDAWLFTLLFGAFLYVGFIVFKALTKDKIL
ncbi:DUF1361 domain-containing protein [Sabulilitoribacter multivorans]|uniref:DUF1361 domain-containing protein n=2 Tax=Flaviramulus multivorans TaxID=1304750 RepID=A0ABS9IJ43_9FLAO|nr:DUF1361 domain-containing protein [Flaviramulus multivorans]